MWLAAAACGLTRITSTKTSAGGAWPVDAEGWVSFGLDANLELMEQLLETPYYASIVVLALMTSYVDQRRLVTWDEIVDLIIAWRYWPARRRTWAHDEAWWRAHEHTTVRAALGRLADTGLCEESEEGSHSPRPATCSSASG